MALDCTDQAGLAAAAKCLACLPAKEREAVKVYLLSVIAGVDPDPEALIEAAKCFLCYDTKESRAVQTYLLCKIVP